MESKFKDKILICIDCREEFVFTVSAQEYFAEKGFTEDPKRCKSCYMDLKRNKRQAERELAGRGRQDVGLPEDDLDLEAEEESIGNSAKESDLD